MEALKDLMTDIIDRSDANNKIFKRNLLKEFLQIVVLDFIYSRPDYAEMIFYGGSCLAQCFGLPRLSEDLDFVDLRKKIDLKALAHDIADYFNNKTYNKI